VLTSSIQAECSAHVNEDGRPALRSDAESASLPSDLNREQAFLVHGYVR
jgi:hypothetical protein